MADKPQIKEAIPILPSLNLDETSAFYARLGFVEDSRWPDEYLIVCRDDGEIHFWACDDPELLKNSSCYVYVEDAAALYAEYLAEGVEQMKAPEQTDYDILEFSVTDPHGNLLRIGSESPAAET
jgi:catechol 2,3-dioxygenase-like lactoylglutathione lyase family enzyme